MGIARDNKHYETLPSFKDSKRFAHNYFQFSPIEEKNLEGCYINYGNQLDRAQDNDRPNYAAMAALALGQYLNYLLLYQRRRCGGDGALAIMSIAPEGQTDKIFHPIIDNLTQLFYLTHEESRQLEMPHREETLNSLDMLNGQIEEKCRQLNGLIATAQEHLEVYRAQQLRAPALNSTADQELAEYLKRGFAGIKSYLGCVRNSQLATDSWVGKYSMRPPADGYEPYVSATAPQEIQGADFLARRAQRDPSWAESEAYKRVTSAHGPSK